MSKPRFKINQSRHMCVTPIARLSFPSLFTPVSFGNDADGKKNYRCDLIFTKDQLVEKYDGKKVQTPSILEVINNAKEDMWGADKSKWPKMSFPSVKKGDENTNKDGETRLGYEGMFYISAKTGEKYPPKVVGPGGQELSEREVYGGCYVRAQIVASAYDTPIGKGVSFYLNQVLKVKDGERFGGMSTDIFDEVEFETVEVDSDDF